VECAACPTASFGVPSSFCGLQKELDVPFLVMSSLCGQLKTRSKTFEQGSSCHPLGCPSCAGGHCTKPGCGYCPHSGSYCNGEMDCCQGAAPASPPEQQEGKWGPNCTATCPFNCAVHSCNRNTGTCNGCTDGKWYGVNCESQCSLGCNGGQCGQLSGECSTCGDGSTGKSCRGKCPPHCGFGSTGLPVCNKITGSCNGLCESSIWVGENCDQNAQLLNGCNHALKKTLGIFESGVSPASLSCAAIAARWGETCIMEVVETPLGIASLIFDWPLVSMACLGTGAFSIGACEFIRGGLVDKAAEWMCEAAASWIPKWLLPSSKRHNIVGVPRLKQASLTAATAPTSWPKSFISEASIVTLNMTTAQPISSPEQLTLTVDARELSINRRSVKPSLYDLSVAINCTLYQGVAVATDNLKQDCVTLQGAHLPECVGALGYSLGGDVDPTGDNASYLSYLLESVFNVTIDAMTPLGPRDAMGQRCWTAVSEFIRSKICYCDVQLLDMESNSSYNAPVNITGDYPLSGTRVVYSVDSFAPLPSDTPFLVPKATCPNESYYVLGEVAQSCTDTCNTWDSICDPHITTNNSVAPFQRLGILCDEDPREWWADDQPAYEPSTNTCYGVTGIPNSVPCSGASSKTERLCNCKTTLPQFYVVGEVGDDCTSTCTNNDATCNPHFVTWNSVIRFQELGVNCTADPRPWWANDQPAYEPSSGSCLGFKDVPISVPCSGSYHSTKRLCHCIPNDPYP
jgi:hypothetical protein